MNLVHDTICRRARTAIAQTAHAADDVLTRFGRRERRVLFEAASPLSLAVFRPVLAELQRDPRIELSSRLSAMCGGASGQVTNDAPIARETQTENNLSATFAVSAFAVVIA